MSTKSGEETGSVLIMTMAFLLVGSLIAAVLLSWTSTGLLSDASATTAQDLHFSANAAAQIAVEVQRYQFQNLTSPVWDCTPPESTVFEAKVKVYCTMSPRTDNSPNRVLTLSVCRADVAQENCVGSDDVGLKAYLSAQVTYYDYDSQGVLACSSLVHLSCGEQMTINSWQFR